MNNSVTISFDTLTPLWTGNADQKADTLRETGLLGSLRWWYEIFVRSQGYQVCDPSAEEKICHFNAEAYQQAKAQGKPEKDAIRCGLKDVCPVCYLFGATGWARLFQLRASGNETEKLYFCTSCKSNQSWLKTIFESSLNKPIPFGKGFELHIIPRGYDDAYAIGQVRLAMWLAATYGGLGARLQHGFGQIRLAESFFDQWQVEHAITQFYNFTQSFSSPKIQPHPFSLQNFFSATYRVSDTNLGSRFSNYVVTKASTSYIPCVFDLRYKGNPPISGMRQWLKNQGRNKSEITEWLGSTKGDKCAGRLFFGMPYLENGAYHIRVFGFGFVPPKITAKDGKELCYQYFQEIFDHQVEEETAILGADLLKEWSNYP